MMEFIKKFTIKKSFILEIRHLDPELLKQAIDQGYVERMEFNTKGTYHPCVRLTKLGRLERLKDDTD